MDRTGINALDCRCKTYRKDMVSIERRTMSYLEAIMTASNQVYLWNQHYIVQNGTMRNSTCLV